MYLYSVCCVSCLLTFLSQYLPFVTCASDMCLLNKKLSYRQGTARCVVSVEILPIATQQCSTTSPEQIEVMKLEG